MSATDGLQKIVSDAFTSVFRDLNTATESWLEKTHILSLGRKRYAEYIAERVGRFPLFGTSLSASIDRNYITVRFSTDSSREVYRGRQVIERELREEQQGEDFPLRRQWTPPVSPTDALEGAERGVALVGGAGSGKTTAFRYLTLTIARGIPIRKKRRLAIFIAVRDIAEPKQSLQAAAQAFLEKLGVGFAAEVLEKLFASGALALLVDGLDETGKEHQRQLVTETMELRARYPEAVFCLSARPLSLSIGLPGFDKWEILPLSPHEKRQFVAKWFDTVDESQGRRLLDISQKEPGLLALGSNPLLLSMICALFHNDLELPKEEDELYERAIEGLLGRWDAFRNIARETKLSSLSVRRRITLLIWLAATQFEGGNIVFTALDLSSSQVVPEASKALRAALPEESELLEILFNDFGILSERSPGLYSFSHLALQEYLTARFIVENRVEEALVLSHYGESSWVAIFRMTAKILPSADGFLRKLHGVTDVYDRRGMSLLLEVWAVSPICSKSLRIELISALAKRFISELDNYSIQGRPAVRVRVAFRKLFYWSEIGEDLTPVPLEKEALKLLANLPILNNIIVASGSNFKELSVAQHELFHGVDFPEDFEVDEVILGKPEL